MRSRSAAVAAFVFSLVFATTCHAAIFSNLYVFGDSLSDGGNNYLGFINGVPPPNTPKVTPQSAITSNSFIPTFPYASTQYSNGNVWAYGLAASLGLSLAPSLAGGTDYAFGGATTGPNPSAFPYSVLTQTQFFLGSLNGGAAPADALYVVAGGGNDARAALGQIGPSSTPAQIAALIASTAQQFAANIGQIVDQLQGVGARNIVVWDVPNIGLAPALLANGQQASGLATQLSQTMNAALAAQLALETGVTTFDLFGLITSVNANPGAYGLANAIDACGVLQAACDPSTYLFWDGIHPTSAGHAIIAQSMYAAVVPEPSTYALVAAGLLLVLVIGRRRAPLRSAE